MELQTLTSQIRNSLYRKPSSTPQASEAQNLAQTEQSSNHKKRKIATLSLGGAFLVGIAGILLQPKFFGKKAADFFNEYGQKLANGIKEGTQKVDVRTMKKNGDKLQDNVKKFSDKFFNINNNFATMKDIYVKKVTDKIPFFKAVDEKMSNLYENVGKGMVKKAYKKAQGAFDLTDSKILEKLGELENPRQGIQIGAETKTKKQWIETVKNLIEQRRKALSKLTSENAQESRFEKIKQATEGIDAKVREKIGLGKNLKEKNIKGLGKNLSESFVAQDILTSDKERFALDLIEKKNVITSNDSNVKGLTERIDKILESLLGEDVNSSQIKPFTRRSDKFLDKAVKMEGNDLVDKMRDVKGGCAQMDAYSIASTVALTGLYLGQADSREERVSVSLTSGVPLGVAILASTIATMKMISGKNVLIIGAISGAIANIIGRSADKIYRKHTSREDEEVSIPTLNSVLEKYASDFEDFSKNVNR